MCVCAYVHMCVCIPACAAMFIHHSYIGHGELYEAKILNVRPDVKNGVPVWQVSRGCCLWDEGLGIRF